MAFFLAVSRSYMAYTLEQFQTSEVMKFGLPPAGCRAALHSWAGSKVENFAALHNMAGVGSR
jgi:hypothetical protein